MTSDKVTIILTTGDTMEVHPGTPVAANMDDGAPFQAEHLLKDEAVSTVYEPLREFWTPYEPWMRDVLTDDARVSWLDWRNPSSEHRNTWGNLTADSAALVHVGALVHPDDVPERPTEERDLWKAKHAALRADVKAVAAGTANHFHHGILVNVLADDAARAARDHIEREREDAPSADVLVADMWKQYRRAEKAEADLADMTRQRDEWRERYVELSERMDEAAQDFRITAAERDEWQARYKALRAAIQTDPSILRLAASDIEAQGTGWWKLPRGLPATLRGIADALTRDDLRGEQG